MNRDAASDSRIEAAATRLLLRRDAGWSREDAAEFALWRAADPRHEKAVQRVEAAQRLLRRLPEAPGAADLLDEVEVIYAAGTRARAQSRRWWIAGTTLAAAAAVAVTLWFVGPRDAAPAPQLAALNAARTFELTDGSRVFVEGQGEIDVQFQAHERRVVLSRGEACFSVAKDAARPFIVVAGNVEVRAVGTVFNVRRGGAFAEVSVSEGKVQVSRLAAGAAPAPEPIFLEVGQSARVDYAVITPLAANASVNASQGVNAAAGLRLKFDKTRLADVVAQFNRHSRVQLELGDAALATRPVDGTFDANQAEAFAHLMAQSGELRIERLSDTRLVLRNAR